MLSPQMNEITYAIYIPLLFVIAVSVSLIWRLTGSHVFQHISESQANNSHPEWIHLSHTPFGLLLKHDVTPKQQSFLVDFLSFGSRRLLPCSESTLDA
jgi:hypothetical protein